MPFLADAALDALLAYVRTNGTRIDICHTEPATYANIATYTVGNKTGVVVGASGDRSPNGRKATVPAITGGSITATSTGTSNDAQYWALSDGSSILVAAGALSSAQMVTTGNTFTLTAFDIGVPDAA